MPNTMSEFRWSSQGDLRRSEGGLGRVDAGELDAGFGLVQAQVAGVGWQPGSDRAGGDLVGGPTVGAASANARTACNAQASRSASLSSHSFSGVRPSKSSIGSLNR